MALVSMSRNAIIFLALIAVGNAQDCVPRDFGLGGTVCVCNATYCDSAAVNVPARGQFRSYESGRDGKRMSQEIGSIDKGTSNNNDVSTVTLSLNPNQIFQKIHGFGAAFTDAAGINIRKLSEGAQYRLLETYFGVNGSRYTLGRVPIAGSDFSTRAYTYDDHNGDLKLERFAFTNEDYEYKIPFMKKALELNPSLRFISSSWSAPSWMKTNDAFNGIGNLKPVHYQTYADYILKFLIEYKKLGLPIWAVTTGNEPADNLQPPIKFSTMGWTPETMADWVGNNLGPTIAGSESNDTIIFMLEDQRSFLPGYAVEVFRNPAAMKYITGISVHWYFDFLYTPEVLDATNKMFPDKFLILTEASIGGGFTDTPGVRLGDWQRAQRFVLDIMENLNHWMTGWMDWNLALDKHGGPNYVGISLDSSIIVNPETDEFFKEPMYYALAHFSKFIGPGSMRIGITANDLVSSTAFLTTNNEIVIVLYNKSSEEQMVTIADPEQGNVSTRISPYSVKTIIYKR